MNVTARRVVLASLLCCSLPAIAANYRFDTEHSQILASTDHNGYSRPVGRLHIADGWLRFDPDDWGNAATELDIDLDSIDFGNTEWNRALRKGSWLDTTTARHAHFVSTGVTRKDDDHGVLHGQLTLRGITLPVDVDFHFNRLATTVFGMHRVAGFSATASFLRDDFGMRANPHSVGNRVDLRLEIEAIRDHNAERDYRRDRNHELDTPP